MNQKHVPSLEHCQEFNTLCKEKGITIPETEFYWKVGKASGHANLTTDKPDLENWTKTDDGFDWYHAPLVSEQGEWLPARIVLETKLLKKEESVILYYIKYEDDASDCDGTNLEDCVKTKWTVECGKEIIRETNEANARQSMINYLIAEGIITKL